MKRFVEGTDRGQRTLFPETLDDWVGEENAVRVIDILVDELDLAELGFDRVEPDRIVSVSRFGSGAPFGGFCQCRGYVELFRDLMGGLRRCRRPRALGKGQYLGPHGCHQRAGAENVDQAREVISQDVQRHFGSDSRECLHQEVSCAHPRLDRAEGVLHRLAPLAHPLRVLVEPPLDRLKNILMLPAGDPPFPARGAAVPDGTVQTCVGPVTP